MVAPRLKTIGAVTSVRVGVLVAAEGAYGAAVAFMDGRMNQGVPALTVNMSGRFWMISHRSVSDQPMSPAG